MSTSTEFFIQPTIAKKIGDYFTKISISPYSHYDDFFLETWKRIGCLPISLIDALFCFRKNVNSPGYILIKGLPTDPNLCITPTEWFVTPKNKKTYVSEGCLILFGSILGELFSYEEEDGGIIIRSIVPTQDKSIDGTGFVGSNDLQMHTEIAWSPFRPNFVLLYCLRGDQYNNAITKIANNKDIYNILTKNVINELRAKQFRFGLPETLRKKVSQQYYWTKYQPIIMGDDNNPEFCVNFNYTKSKNKKALAALNYLKDAIDNVSKGLVLKEGEVLIFDNRKTLHARSSYAPSFDGKDRWLQQALINKDLWLGREAIFYRKNNFRAIKLFKDKLL